MVNQFLKTNFSVFDMFGIFLPAIVFCCLFLMINYYPISAKTANQILPNTLDISCVHLYYSNSFLNSFSNPKIHEYSLFSYFPPYIYPAYSFGNTNKNKKTLILPLYGFIKKIKSIFKNETQRFIIYILVSCIVIYFVGHVIMAFGSSFIDRFIVAKCLSYPYENLFSKITFVENAEFEWHCFRKIFYSTVLLNFCFLLLIILYLNSLIFTLFSFMWLFCMILFRIYFSSKRSKLNKNNKRSKQQNNKRRQEQIEKELTQLTIKFESLFSFCSVFTSYIYIGLYNFLKNLHSHEPFSKKFQENFKKMFEEYYSIEMKYAKESIFWFCLAYVHDKCPNACVQLSYARRLAYLFRNLAASFFLAFAICIIVQFFYWNQVNFTVYASCFLGLSIFSFIRFYCIYFNSFSKNVFRVFYEGRCRLELLSENGKMSC